MVWNARHGQGLSSDCDILFHEAMAYNDEHHKNVAAEKPLKIEKVKIST